MCHLQKARHHAQIETFLSDFSVFLNRSLKITNCCDILIEIFKGLWQKYFLPK